MQNNNQINKTKRTEREEIVYATIFVLYFGFIILIFAYSVKFLGETINAVLSDPQGKANEESYGQLNLESYLLISDKLKLNNAINNNNSDKELLNRAIATSSEEIMNKEVIATSSDLSIKDEISNNTLDSIVEEIRPTIIVMNSTVKSGLASKLKTKLEKAGFTVLKSGNLKPTKDISIIYLSKSFDQNSKYLFEIKKIVSEDYNFVILPLENDSQSDIQIIIGNQ
ncbi:MAG: LytR C-terminal domain-containing protein [Patescibacteria group bacterium]